MDDKSDSIKCWESPDKRFSKIILSKGYGFCSPQDGSVCKLKVIADDDGILTDVDSEHIKELIVGDVDDPVDRLLEACVKSMKHEEICLLKFQDPLHILSPCDKVICENSGVSSNRADYLTINVNCKEGETTMDKMIEENETLDKINSEENKNIETIDKISCDTQINSEDDDHESEIKIQNQLISDGSNLDDVVNSVVLDDSSELLNSTMPKMYEVKLQLLIYTREPEIYEMSITEKWRRANYHKQKGMELYARGSYEWAFRRFGLALKYLISLEHDLPSGQEEGMNIIGLKLSCFLNVAACQMRHHNYNFVVRNCTKALKLQPDNSKALYRRGAAFVQLQEYEKAKEDLDKAQVMEPKNQAIVKQQQLLKARVQKLNCYYANAMKKMFT